MSKSCLVCNSILPKKHKVFCSKNCRYSGKVHPHSGRKKISFIKICINCNNEFFVAKHRDKTAKFCSRLCQCRYQSNRMDRVGPSNPVWKGGNSIHYYIKHAWPIHGPWCHRCGFDARDIHHIDFNNKNNPSDGSNWMPLCRSCHKLVHYGHELIITSSS